MIVTAILARNEADRYLTRVIRHHQALGPVLVLDDQSEDRTADAALSAGAQVRIRDGAPMWGQESTARQELWTWGAEVCGNDWLLIADADQLLMGDVKPLTSSWVVNTWCFPLYDCWDTESHYRADGFWQGYKHPRAWLFRPSLVPEGWAPTWGVKGIHSGHCPANWPMVAGVAPADCFWVHLGYVQAPDRRRKYQKYRDVWDQLSPFERAHATSILESA